MEDADFGARRRRSSVRQVFAPSLAYSAVAAGTAAVLFVIHLGSAHGSMYTRDPLAVAQALSEAGAGCCSPYIGVVSTLGVCLFFAAAAISAFAAALVKGRRERFLFVIAALLMAFLGADDLLMLHENWPYRIVPGISELLLAQAGLFAVLLWSVYRSANLNWSLMLATAAIGFALSIGLDKFGAQTMDLILIEDSFKFVGIAALAAFTTLRAFDAVANASARQPSEGQNS